MKFKLIQKSILSSFLLLAGTQLACGTSSYKPMHKNRAYLTSRLGTIYVEKDQNVRLREDDFDCGYDVSEVYADRSYQRGRTGAYVLTGVGYGVMTLSSIAIPIAGLPAFLGTSVGTGLLGGGGALMRNVYARANARSVDLVNAYNNDPACIKPKL